VPEVEKEVVEEREEKVEPSHPKNTEPEKQMIPQPKGFLMENSSLEFEKILHSGSHKELEMMRT